MWFLIFDGEPRGYPPQTGAEVAGGHFEAPAHEAGASHGHEHEHEHHANPVVHAHESPRVMTWPLVILAVFSIVVGWGQVLYVIPNPFGTPELERMLETAEPLRAHDLGAVRWWALASSLLIAAVGIALAVGYYSRWRVFKPSTAAHVFRPVYDWFVNKWYFDEMYDFLFVRPTLALARGLRGFDLRIIDGVVNGSASVTKTISFIGGAIDKYVVDGIVNVSAWILYGFGLLFRVIQTGHLRFYLGILALGFVALFTWMLVWIR
jgi:NADH:ubiquinone oxidoreductase subunit 5 (subunit L)/multisubunit Na+/H+ antiporter MnhA subunit